jgi:hypothetical protein
MLAQEKVDKLNSIEIYFQWETLQPDQRQYKTASPTMHPMFIDGTPVSVVVLVPLKKEYIYNADKIIKAQMNPNQYDPIPVLTVAGMEYCENVLLKRSEKVVQPNGTEINPSEFDGPLTWDDNE